MVRKYIDPAELELRRDHDFLRSENMVGEGAPVHGALNECEVVVKRLEAIDRKLGYEGPPKSRSCEL